MVEGAVSFFETQLVSPAKMSNDTTTMTTITTLMTNITTSTTTPSEATSTGEAKTIVLDPWFLAITFLASFGINFFFYIFACALKMDKLTDITYSMSFIALAVLAFCLGQTYYQQQIAMLVAILLWALRIGGYLLTRIIKIGHDKRFDAYRASWWRFGIFWFFQAVVVWLTFLPPCLLFSDGTRHAWTWRESLGFTIFAVCLIGETVADQQKFAFRNNPANDKRWTDVGLWKWSRHPNFFFEIMLWWGLFIVASVNFTPGQEFKYFSLIGPFLLTLSILFFSGITRLEEAADKRYWFEPAYQQYKQQTSPLIPLPPAFFNAMPLIVKRFLFFEFPNYTYPQTKPPVADASKGQTVKTPLLV
jgi:steroid 5-alpha reductase family enzyme